MIPATVAGVWAATQAPPALVSQWVQPANGGWPAYATPVTPLDEAEHYFLVISAGPDGALRAFIRNPEANAGVSLGTRTLAQNGATLTLKSAGKPDVTGSENADGTLTFAKVPPLGTSVTFHRATVGDLTWYYPRGSARWAYGEPVVTGDGWPVGTLESVGLRLAPIAEIMNGIVAERTPSLRSPYIQSIAIARHGHLVLDEYFYGFSAGTPHDVRSAGKSLTTLLVGRAIEDTSRFTPSTSVLSFLPQYAPAKNLDARKQRMTVANLMTMSSGFACDDNDDSSPGNEDVMQSQSAQPDWYKYTLDLPMLYDPGSRAVYCSAGINLLGAIVSTATGIPLQAYFRDRFAAPMQFQDYAMNLMPPPTNAAYMGGGEYFRPRDFLKLGQLFLNHGTWNGRRIIGDDWLQASVVSRSIMNEDAAGEGDHYGYGWHLGKLTVDGRTYDFINAGGNGGQLLVVVPKLDMAIMITAGNYGQYPVWSSFIDRIAGAAIRAAD